MKDISFNKLFIVGVGLTFTTLAIIEMREEHKKGVKERQEIAEKSRQEIRNLWAAAIETQKEIERGQHKSLKSVQEAFDFNIIAKNNDDIGKDE